MAFQISALDRAQFAELFTLNEEELKERGAIRVVADGRPAFPCRVSLEDAREGEELLLVNYQHQPADTPYRASHAIYVRREAAKAQPAANEIPESLGSRVLSLRGFDERGMMEQVDLADGRLLAPALERMLADARVAYVHLHYANAGCYAARADRA